MLNLIRMNGYRARHMTCMYVLGIIICLFAIFSIATISTTSGEIKDGEFVPYETPAEAMEAGYNEAKAEAEGTAEDSDNDVTIQLGLISEQPIRADGTITSYLAYIYEDITSGIMLIFMTIAVVLFFNREQNSGFIKNIASKSTSRVNIYFSKFIVMALYTLVSLLLLAVAEYIALLVYYKGDVKFGVDVIGDFLPKMGIIFLLHLAFISGVVMVTTLSKSSTLGITIGMLANTGFSTFIVMPIKAWFDIDISKYLVTPNIAKLNLNSTGDVITDTFLVGIIWLIVYNIIGCAYFAKKDIV